MSTAVDIFVLLVVATAVIAALIYISEATTALGKVKNYKKDPNLSDAYQKLVSTTAVCWILIILLVVGLIVTFIFGPELFLLWGGLFLGGLIFLMIAFATTIGVMASIAAYDMNLTGNTGSDKDLGTAYKDAIIAACIALGTIGILGLLFISYFVNKYRHDAALKLAQDNLRQLRTEQYYEQVIAEASNPPPLPPRLPARPSPLSRSSSSSVVKSTLPPTSTSPSKPLPKPPTNRSSKIPPSKISPQ